MDSRSKCKIQNYKTLRRQCKSKPTIPKVQFIKEILNKLDFIKLKNLCFTKGNVRIRRQAID